MQGWTWMADLFFKDVQRTCLFWLPPKPFAAVVIQGASENR